MRRVAPLLLLPTLIMSACGSGNDSEDQPIPDKSTTVQVATATASTPAPTTPATSTAATTLSIPTGCDREGTPQPEEVWLRFVVAFNEADMTTLGCLISPGIEWTWDNELFAIHRGAHGADEALYGLEDLIDRGVSFETRVLNVEGNTVTAETVFNEPALVQMMAGKALLQIDLVTIDSGLIQTWTSTANETVDIEG